MASSAASGESFSSVSATDTLEDGELSASQTNKSRSSSLSALGVSFKLLFSLPLEQTIYIFKSMPRPEAIPWPAFTQLPVRPGTAPSPSAVRFNLVSITTTDRRPWKCSSSSAVIWRQSTRSGIALTRNCRFLPFPVMFSSLPNFLFLFLRLQRYAKVYLLPDRSKSGKRKTKVKKHTLSPLFEENLKVKWQIALSCE